MEQLIIAIVVLSSVISVIATGFAAAWAEKHIVLLQ